MNGQGTSIIGAFRDVITKQGPLALYRGLPAQLVGIMPEKVRAILLSRDQSCLQNTPLGLAAEQSPHICNSKGAEADVIQQPAGVHDRS